MRAYYVYILPNKRYGTLYTGVTSNLIERIYQYKNNFVHGFTEKYHLHRLVYYETTYDVLEAIKREKKLKRWRKVWKYKLIDDFNPQWDDLYDKLC